MLELHAKFSVVEIEDPVRRRQILTEQLTSGVTQAVRNHEVTTVDQLVALIESFQKINAEDVQLDNIVGQALTQVVSNGDQLARDSETLGVEERSVILAAQLVRDAHLFAPWN